MKVGIIGNGFVGKATRLLECDDIQILTYDIVPDLCNPIGTTLKNISSCDLIFITVPTPMNTDGSCHLGILEGVVSELKDLGAKNNIIIRSTVPPGTSDRLNCNFMPEELNWLVGDKEFVTRYKELCRYMSFTGSVWEQKESIRIAH